MYRTIQTGTARSSVRILVLAADALDRSLRAGLKQWNIGPAAAAGFLADNGETRVLDDSTILLGVGRCETVTTGSIRVAAARLIRVLERMKVSSATITLGENSLPKAADRGSLGRGFGEGIALANWRVKDFDGSATTRKPAQGSLSVHATDRDFFQGIGEGLALGESANFARALAATPPNICTPAWIATEARRLAKSTRLKCRVISFADAQRMGMGGLVNVGQGSDAKPCMVVLDWTPAKTTRASKDVHLCLIGKTLTYDTGGYSLKINNGMKGMKYDKCGGTAVLGAMHAIATAKLPVRVTAILPAAENMVSGNAYRPDDIITLYNGVTVEVTNTDAEGRLVLADALAWACRTIKPTHIVDLATLTGGVVTALGSWCAGLMCNDADLRGRIERAGEQSGDRVWHLPLWQEHREHMRSQHADLINSNPSRLAHPLMGGAFLSYFVDEKIPWAHVDVAGGASADSTTDLFVVPGPTGFGVRLLYDFVSAFA